MPVPDTGTPSTGVSRRGFLTVLVAAPTLSVGVRYGLLDGVAAAAPGTPEYADHSDLGDALILAQKPTESLMIVLEVREDGTVACELPRMEVGQGITTAVAMLVADELALPLRRVSVTLADARPELVFAQITGGSNTIRSVYEPVRAAAAEVRARMGAAAADRLALPVEQVRVQDGVLLAADGRTVGFGEVAVAARSAEPRGPVAVSNRRPLVGTPQKRIDARAMVTGAFRYTGDLSAADLLADTGDRHLTPTTPVLRSMVRRAPYIRGRVVSVDNAAEVLALPGAVDLFVVELSRVLFDGEEVVETGVAVVAETSGQALDMKEALVVTWDERPGPLTNPLKQFDDEEVRAALRGINPPLSPAPPGATVVEAEFDFAFVSHAPLESNTAVAYVRDGRADVWSGLKIPIVAQQTIADELGLPQDAVKAHVVQGGGSFGRKLFFDPALEAARIAAALDARRPQADRYRVYPVKHLWTRIDDMRHGRARPASHHRVQLAAVGKDVVKFEQRAAFVETDWRHGLGEAVSAAQTQLNAPLVPVSTGGNNGYSQFIFDATVKSPYQFGATEQSLAELNLPFNTAAWRSVYSPNTRGAEEIVLDRLAARLGEDPARFRLARLDTARQREVLQRVLELGGWRFDAKRGTGTAQGVAFHEEYKSFSACLVEIDARDPESPRVTKAAIVADYGIPINPRGAEAQLLGGLSDGIATALRAGLHLEEGLFLEGSYSQFFYTRQDDYPTEVKVEVLPAREGAEPGGGGELGVPAGFAAVVNAYERATGRTVTRFPIIFPDRDQLTFTPFPKGTGSTRVNPR